MHTYDDGLWDGSGRFTPHLSVNKKLVVFVIATSKRTNNADHISTIQDQDHHGEAQVRNGLACLLPSIFVHINLFSP